MGLPKCYFDGQKRRRRKRDMVCLFSVEKGGLETPFEDSAPSVHVTYPPQRGSPCVHNSTLDHASVSQSILLSDFVRSLSAHKLVSQTCKKAVNGAAKMLF